jgi:hypothetical protein
LSLAAAVAVGSFALLAGSVAAGSVGAAPAGAPGNNGTVKIHEGPGEPAPETRNEPHVCTFHVHALFFDAAQELSFTVTSWPPTGDRSVVLSGTITADGTGEGRTPGEYELPNGHYRLTVDTGNGKPTQDKHKMFWVRCAAPTTPPGPPGGDDGDDGGNGNGNGGGNGGGDGTITPTVSPTTPAVSPTTPAMSLTTPAGSPTTPPALGSEVPTVPPAGLAQTGSSALVPIAGLGLALLLAGVALAFTPAAGTRLRR